VINVSTVLSENWGVNTKEIKEKQKFASDQEKAINDRIEEMQAQLETMKIKVA
jgi:hypothetical protein